MAGLLDDVRKLKAQRQECAKAEHSVSQVSNGLLELEELYSAINKKSAFIRGVSNTAKDEDKKELERLEKSFSFRWCNLSDDKQKELVDRLLEKGVLPKAVKQVLDRFGGKVTSIL